jgi:flavodoxin
MPRALVARFSQTGTTAQVAKSIAKGLGTAGWQVDLHDIIAE